MSDPRDIATYFEEEYDKTMGELMTTSRLISDKNEELDILMHEAARMENTIFDILVLMESFPEARMDAEPQYYWKDEVDEWLNKLKSILSGTTSS